MSMASITPAPEAAPDLPLTIMCPAESGPVSEIDFFGDDGDEDDPPQPLIERPTTLIARRAIFAAPNRAFFNFTTRPPPSHETSKGKAVSYIESRTRATDGIASSTLCLVAFT